MNYDCAMLLDSIAKLELSMGEPTEPQRLLLDKIKGSIKEMGRYFPVADLTIEGMREHGYDVTEEDSGLVEKIAQKVDVSEEVWIAVEIWADSYGVKQIDD